MLNRRETAIDTQVTIGTIGDRHTSGGLKNGEMVKHGTVADTEELMEVQMETGRKDRQITGVGEKPIAKRVGCKVNGFTAVRPQ